MNSKAALGMAVALVLGPGCARPKPENLPGLPQAFGDGAHTAGKDVATGIYENKAPGPDCGWTFKTIANEIDGPGHSGDGKRDPAAARDRWVLELQPGNRLTTNGCGQWTKYVHPGGEPPTTLAKGTHYVGPEAKPGSYQVAGTTLRVEVYGLEGASRGGTTFMRSRAHWETVCKPDPSIPDCNGNTMGVGLTEGMLVRVVPDAGSTLVWYG